jgi:flagellar biosynthesis protein FlhG
MSTVYRQWEDELIDSLDEAHEKARVEEESTSTNDAVHLSPARAAKSQVICVASGKGGTGKTLVATNLSVLLAREGLRVVLLDADFGLANSHLLMGVDPTDDVSSVLSGEKELADIIVDGPAGVKLVPGGSGLSELTMLGDDKFRHLITELSQLESLADVIIVDLAAGISPQVMALLGAAHETIVVITPEITSLVDGYALIKSLTRMSEKVSAQIIVNRAPDKARADVAFQKISSVANKHLGDRVSLKYLGWIPQNWYVLNSVACRKPLVLRHPQSFATACFELMTAKTLKRYLKWQDAQAQDFASPSYFGKLEQMIYGS